MLKKVEGLPNSDYINANYVKVGSFTVTCTCIKMYTSIIFYTCTCKHCVFILNLYVQCTSTCVLYTCTCTLYVMISVLLCSFVSQGYDDHKLYIATQGGFIC